ncbi:MAG: hypothetical protein LUG52_09285 [Clostridia bacterium]|nr:hypothetical protein [Clostridia bacterium]
MKFAVVSALLVACILTLVSITIGYVSGDLILVDQSAVISEEKAAVVFVIGGHANSQGLNFNSSLVQNTVYNTVKNYGFIGIVSVDGSPEVIHAASYDINDMYKSASDTILESDAREKANNIIYNMQSITADDAEADYLESLRLASRLLSSLDGYDSKQIIVIGTGLSTTGVLDFSNNLISAEPEVIAELLSEKSEIPSFSDMTVYWQQLGDVAEPQNELTAKQRLNLKNVWQAIVEAGGGSFVYDESIANSADTAAQLPEVTPIELPQDTPISFDPVSFESLSADAFEDLVILTESQVTFIEDKS